MCKMPWKENTKKHHPQDLIYAIVKVNLKMWNIEKNSNNQKNYKQACYSRSWQVK
jgi:hypothetical protein